MPTSPGGLWGPDGSSLVDDAATVAKERAQAEKAMGKVLQRIQALAPDTPAAASLMKEQTVFAGQRDETCGTISRRASMGFARCS